MLDHAGAKARWPGLVTDQAKAILWCPSDGYLQPYDLAMAYREHARAAGVRFATDVRVSGIALRGRRGRGGRDRPGPGALRQGHQRRRRPCLACGASGGSRSADRAGAPRVRHHSADRRSASDLPTFRVPDATLYGRPDVGALLLGGWEPAARSCDPREYALAGEPPAIEPDWPVLANFAEQMAPLYPPVANAGIRHVFRGWPTFTPDGRFIVGESRRVPGLVMAAGCNAHGVSGSAGIGRHVVEALLEPKPSAYVRSLSPDRFTESAWNWDEARRRAQAIYETLLPHRALIAREQRMSEAMLSRPSGTRSRAS